MNNNLITPVLALVALLASVSTSSANNLLSIVMTASLSSGSQDTVNVQRLEVSKVDTLLASLKNKDPFVRVKAV